MPDEVFTWENFSSYIAGFFGLDEDEFFHLESSIGSHCRINLESDLFSGSYAFYEFRDDLRMLVIDGQFGHPVEMRITDGDWIRFNFALSITLDMGVVGANAVNLESPSWRIVDHPPGTVVVETPPAGAEERWVTVICKNALIERITGRSKDDLPEFLRTVTAEQHQSSVYRDFHIRSRLLAITSDIITTPVESPIYIPYMEARATELLCLALDELLDPISLSSAPTVEDPVERGKLEAAHAYIRDNYRSSPTIVEIARHAGLNRNSLYYGFKRRWGVNVSEFLQSLKLEEAHRLLLQSPHSVNEIAEMVGFKHQSNLTTAFRKKYGLTPSRLRRETR